MNDSEVVAIERSRQIVAGIVRKLVLLDSGDFRRIIWFGSHLSGHGSDESDFDLMVLIEPSVPGWGPRDNIAERQRLESVLTLEGTRLDLWVRTVDQFEEARSVVGGLEHAADVHGEVLFSRPTRRPPQIRRSPEQIRLRNVGDWLELARRMLGRSVMLAWPRGGYPQTSAHTPEHYARRAVSAAIGAIFVWRDNEPPSKRDDFSFWLSKLEAIDERATRSVRRELGLSAVTPTVAHGVLRAVVTHLSADRELSAITRNMVLYLGHPTRELGAVPPLKQSGPSAARGVS